MSSATIATDGDAQHEDLSVSNGALQLFDMKLRGTPCIGAILNYRLTYSIFNHTKKFQTDLIQMGSPQIYDLKNPMKVYFIRYIEYSSFTS